MDREVDPSRHHRSRSSSAEAREDAEGVSVTRVHLDNLDVALAVEAT